MFVWQPKTSPTGGLPDSFEPRKPAELGTMIRYGVECVTGIFVHLNIVQGKVEQKSKEYVDKALFLPKREPIMQHVEDILQQADGAKLEKRRFG